MRRLLKEEVEELAQLEEELFPDNCFNEVTLRKQLKSASCWVETRDQKFIGYVIAQVDGNMVDILRIGVLPSHQRTGVGSRLLFRALMEAPKAMLTVKKDNASALRLYFSYGFEIAGHLEEEEAWMMVRAS